MIARTVLRALRRGRLARRMFFVLACLMLVAPAPAVAEILIEPKVGFHGVFQLGHPFPLEVHLENLGPPVEGILEIEVWKGGAVQGAGAPYRNLHQREVFLPARARRSVQFTIDPDLLSRPLRIRFTSTAGSASRELDLRRHFSPAPVVLTMSEGSASLSSLGASLTNRVVALTIAELPHDAQALTGVSHLVLYDVSLRDLSRAQAAALDQWLAAGGRMVVIGSLNFSLYQERQLARYLPVRVTGARRIAFSTHRHAAKGQTIAGVWAQTATVLKGRVVTESDGLPMIVESGWGKGKVVYLALDAGRPPLSTWSGLPGFLQGLLLTPAATENASLRSQWNNAIFSQAVLSPWFVSTYVPTRALFIALAAYLAGLVVLTQLWQRRRLSQRTLAAACCGWIACAAAAGCLYFSRGGQSPEGVLLTATVLDDAGDGYAEAQSNLALFSTQRGAYSLAFGGGWVDPMPLNVSPSAPPQHSAMYRHGALMTRVQLPLESWDFRLLRANHVERLQLSAAIARDEDRISVEARNQSGSDLTDCWLVAPGMRIALGDLPRGESLKRSFTSAVVDGDPGRRTEESLRDIRFNDRPRDVLFHSSFFPQDSVRTTWRNGAALFFGWVKDPEPGFGVDDPRIRVLGYALYRVIVPLPRPEEE